MDEDDPSRSRRDTDELMITDDSNIGDVSANRYTASSIFNVGEPVGTGLLA